ncbi:MAG: hypothetical protein IJ664_06455 [Clostridia bacterium]|nr:hypothetical protein [Clostridia bacterium]
MKDYKLDAAVVLRRNYEDFPFKADSDAEIARRVNDRSVTVLERCQETFTYLLPTALDTERRKELEDKRLLSADAQNAVGGAAYLRDDELMCLETAGTDHLRIAAYDDTGALLPCLNAALSLSAKLEDTGRIAQSPQYGFLTAYPSDAGTGMRASLLLHLPMLTMLKQLSAAMKMASTGGMTLRVLPGGMSLLENRITLGRDEKDIIEQLEAIAKSICTLERSLRWRAKERKDLNVADKGWRAYGLCQYALRMNRQEAISLWSDLVLGFSVGDVPYGEETADELWQIAHLPTEALTRDSALHPDVERARRVRQLMNHGGN